MTPASSWLRAGAAAILVAAFTVVAYWPGLNGPFVLDDDANIRSNVLLHVTESDPQALWEATMSGRSGPLKRPISMLTFALDHLAYGLKPLGYKVTSLAIHLLTGLVVFLLARQLLATLYRAAPREPRILIAAGAVAALWLVHPLHVSTVLYVVQRMTQLSALFVLLGVASYVAGRLAQIDGARAAGRTFVLPAVCGVLAALSKENGALLPLYLLATEVTFFHFAAPRRGVRLTLGALYGLTVGVPAAAALVFLLANPDWLGLAYESRPFTLVERLLTQARVLLQYARLVLLPDTAQMGIMTDGVVLSRSLLEPWTTLPAVAALGALLAGAIVLRRRWAVASFAVVWFLAGHAMESTVIPLELVFEHRNYLPSFGILFAVGALLASRPAPLARLLRMGPAVVVVLFALLAAMTFSRATQWSSGLQLAASEVRHHPTSARAQYMAGRYLQILAEQTTAPTVREDLIDEAEMRFEEALALDPDMVSPLVGRYLLYEFSNRPPPGRLFEELRRRLASALPNATTVNALRQLTDCNVDRVCSLPTATYQAAMDAALSNPRLHGVFRALVLASLSHYHGALPEGESRALQYARRAVEHWPTDIGLRLDIVRLSTATGRYEDALAEVDEIEVLDRLRAHRRAIRGWRETIERRSRLATEPVGSVSPSPARAGDEA